MDIITAFFRQKVYIFCQEGRQSLAFKQGAKELAYNIPSAV